MRLLRGLLAALLWILAGVLALVGLLLCVTLILLPLGVPVLAYARRVWAWAVRLMLPRMFTHPVQELTGAMDEHREKVTGTVSDAAGSTAKGSRKAAQRTRKQFT